MSGLGADGERAWEDLSQHLEWAERSWLAFVFTRSTAAVHELQDRVRAQLAERDRTQRVLRPRTPQQLRELLPLLLATSDAAVTWVEAVHLDPGAGQEPGPWVEAWDWFLLRANERREPLLQSVAGGLILAAPDPLKHRFREAAPDLWSVRALVLSPDLPSPEPPATLDEPTLEVDALLAQGWVSEAAPLAEEALEQARTSAQSRPRDRKARARLANAQERLARVLREQGELEDASSAVDACLEIREALAAGPPARRRTQLSDLACVQALAARIATERGQLDRALALATTAVDTHRRLSRDSDDPETLAELALALSVLGDVELARGDEGGALKHFLDALVLRQHVLGATNAARHRRWLSVAWGRVGQVRLRLGDRVQARSAWQRAWELMQELARRDPGNVAWQMEASVAGCRWGDAAFADDELDLAEQAWTEAVRIREQLAAQDPDNARWQQLLAVAIGRMAQLLAARGQIEAARVEARRALGISEQLVEEHPGHTGWANGLERARRRVEELSADPEPEP